jgi:hypothetical protein
MDTTLQSHGSAPSEATTGPTGSGTPTSATAGTNAEDNIARQQCQRSTTQAHNGLHQNFYRSQRLDGHHRLMKSGFRGGPNKDPGVE